MGDAGFYRGTSCDQDSRFTDKERKLLKQMRFEDALEEKVVHLSYRNENKAVSLGASLFPLPPTSPLLSLLFTSSFVHI
ncbi:unnamed protein product [Toxocara canis]|uniref:Uncharacterized protein n=1 Tax=Toxocara canis TaxID=6265 RepID=A0A183U3P9_TOXCA|nr:unnamed protein product [Toxocara canis]